MCLRLLGVRLCCFILTACMVIGILPVMMRRCLVMPGSPVMKRSRAGISALATDLLVELVIVLFRHCHTAGVSRCDVLFLGTTSCIAFSAVCNGTRGFGRVENLLEKQT